jgi:hypothetical protein
LAILRKTEKASSPSLSLKTVKKEYADTARLNYSLANRALHLKMLCQLQRMYAIE